MRESEYISSKMWRGPRKQRIRMIRKASCLVQAAISKNILPSPYLQTCVDCGGPAQTYDHRFYTRPLEVEPVCNSCNRLRGHAWDLEILCDDMGEPL